MTGQIMAEYIVVVSLMFFVAMLMTMVGKGGGNFYVFILVMAGIPMHQAAATGQFVLFAASTAALFIFQKARKVVWQLALMIGMVTAVSAFFGGYYSSLFSAFMLKIIFSGLLFLAGILMVIHLPDVNPAMKFHKRGLWRVNIGGETIFIDLWMIIPLTILIGFGSGMCGVSGGSFLVPLMVLACGLPMHIAVGTASTLIAAISLMGFVGHAIRGHFSPVLALPLAAITIIGGVAGSKWAVKTRPKHLKTLFAVTNFAAALLMLLHTMLKGG